MKLHHYMSSIVRTEAQPARHLLFRAPKGHFFRRIPLMASHLGDASPSKLANQVLHFLFLPQRACYAIRRDARFGELYEASHALRFDKKREEKDSRFPTSLKHRRKKKRKSKDFPTKLATPLRCFRNPGTSGLFDAAPWLL